MVSPVAAARRRVTAPALTKESGGAELSTKESGEAELSTKESGEAELSTQESGGDEKSSLGWVVLCVVGIYVTFLTQGNLQEAIYSTEVTSTGRRFNCSAFIVAMICASSCLVGLAMMLMNGEYRMLEAVVSVKKSGDQREMLRQGFLTSLTYVGAMTCTNYALTKVNFPTQVLVKSAKAVPVVVGSWLMYRKRYPLSDYVMVAVVTLALLIFQGVQLKSGTTSGSSSIIGFGLLFVSLTFDGMTGPRQDQIISRFKLGIGEMMFLLNIFATPICLMASALMEGTLPWRILSEQWVDFLPKVILVVICGGLGQIVVVTVLRDLGSLHLTLITTTRKFLAILLSVLWYKHSITFLQWVAIAMLFSAVIFKYLVSSTRSRATSKQE